MRQLPVPARLIAAVMTVAASAGCMSVTDHPGRPAPSATKGTQRTDARPDGAAAAPDGGGRARVHGGVAGGSDEGPDGQPAQGESARKAAGGSRTGTVGKGGGTEPSADPSGPGAPRPARPGHPRPGRPPGHGGGPSGRPAPPAGSPTPPGQPSDPPRTSPTPGPGSSPPGATTAPSVGPAKRSEAMLIPLASPQAEPVQQAGFARKGEG
ncbi:hypothetical protein OG372_17165 [Streptomyces sp. NBC_01020]|uniref:hypothetical protein n=1 Tax=unclassified Streptomyces TaxID=2593676 RepID=UPI003254A6A8|nr:hypothetical protein OG372_17165 [Streptomyces sp. NBC_01020]WSX68764.1 hypothetical protein OG221_20295 [Streptomyces sp. NBC_00932]